jgi:hypothetical protein
LAGSTAVHPKKLSAQWRQRVKNRKGSGRAKHLRLSRKTRHPRVNKFAPWQSPMLQQHIERSYEKPLRAFLRAWIK